VTTLSVAAGSARYPIFIGTSPAGLLRCLAVDRLSRIGVVAPRRVLRLHGHPLRAVLRRAGVAADILPIPDGERAKDLAVYARLCRLLARRGYDRGAGLIGFGGGAAGDLAGFVSATFMRGIRLYQVPTTLLAQVDAAIGGKTAVNIPEGKNLVGCFYQPRCVWSNPVMLATLPRREWLNGFAEVIKYGMISDRRFFEFLERRLALPLDAAAIERIVVTAARSKAAVVAADERETRGQRETLNFGHTIGHLLETYFGYEALSHGAAVGLGMIAACQLAEEQCGFTQTDRLVGLLELVGLPVRMPRQVTGNRWHSILSRDKKFQCGRMRFVLPREIGRVRIDDTVSLRRVHKVLGRMNRAVRAEGAREADAVLVTHTGQGSLKKSN